MIKSHDKPKQPMAYCGLLCEGCPIYLASREKDAARQKAVRMDIARKCNELYGVQYGPEDITDCDGCKMESGRLFQGCVKCEIRPCARERKVDSCAHCADYACDKLEKMFKSDPEARTRLDGIRRILQKPSVPSG